ncbi:MAG: alpha/beta hydrolase [Bacteroidales bacterium]|nr:alpha/beta hydrolase [Bacteroidales bacterium]
MAEIPFKGKKINYTIQGEGEPLFLIHGYLESLEIWDEFTEQLARHFKVVRMDLPGHGKSEAVDDTHDMELLAEAAKAVLDENQIISCTVIGHSMGGYVTLAFADLYPEKVNRFSLFHSHPFPDSDQVRRNRQNAIENIKTGKKEEICRSHIPKTFADDNLQDFEEQVERAKSIALQTPEKGIIANLKGMMNRPDRSQLVKNTNKPFLLIAGKKDNFIDYHTVIPKIELPEKGEVVTLEYSGHMGFIEERQRSLDVVRNFMRNE